MITKSPFEIKKEICEVGHKLWIKGFVAANDGNISVKISDNEYYCTPTGVSKGIMMVNGNIGAGVAVAGAFSLVRFRSAPGSAKEIVTIFLAMGAGLIAGMGYLGFAALFTVIMCVMFLIYNALAGNARSEAVNKTIKITIPEDLDYTGAFDDIFAEYTKKNELVKVKTTNMGSMFRLTYNVTLRDATKEKEMIDRIRERNGNLEIMVSKQENRVAEL